MDPQPRSSAESARHPVTAALFAAFSPEAMSPRTSRRGIVVLLLAGLILRTLLSVGPSLDRTTWKELDYLMVIRSLGEVFDPLHPQVTWPADGTRVTAMELPLVPVLGGAVVALVGESAVALRLVTTAAWLLAAGYLFGWLRRELGPLVGLSAAALSLVMATHHVFGRVLLSEPFIVAGMLMALHHFSVWVDARAAGVGRPRDAALAMLGLGVAVALKPTALHVLVPLLWVLVRRGRAAWPLLPRTLALLGGALVLPVAWYAWANHLEQTGMGEFSVFRGHDKFQTLTMLARPDWWSAIFVQGIGRQLLGGAAGLLLVLLGGLVALRVRRGGVLLATLLGGLLYVVLVAEGHQDGRYRQLELVPALSGFAAVGAVAVAAWLSTLVPTPAARRRLRAAGLVGALLLVPAGLGPAGWARALDAARPAHAERWTAAQMLRAHTTRDARVVVAGEYDVKKGGNDLSPVLLLYAQRRGWLLQPGELSVDRVEALRTRGATHLVVVPAWGRAPGAPLPEDPEGEAFVVAARARWSLTADLPGHRLLLFSLDDETKPAPLTRR